MAVGEFAGYAKWWMLSKCGRKSPLVVTIGIGYACNLRCRHCAIDSMLRANPGMKAKLTYDEIVAELRSRYSEGARIAYFEGGETTMWEDSGLVFTNELGHHLARCTLVNAFKAVVTSIGRPDARFHDLRHSYAVAAIRSGDDIKTVQGNLGHATAAFTLDVYGHVTDQMKRESAARMESYIKDVLNL